MSKPLNRRELLASVAVVAAGAAAMNLPAAAQSSASGPDTADSAPPDTTQEGIALVSAAYAAAGHPLTTDMIVEVRKQLSGYPGDFGKARAHRLANGDAPIMGVTPVVIPAKK